MTKMISEPRFSVIRSPTKLCQVESHLWVCNAPQLSGRSYEEFRNVFFSFLFYFQAIESKVLDLSNPHLFTF